MDSNINFYLGVNTSSGYLPLFAKSYSAFESSRAYIVKGGSSKIRSEFIYNLANEIIKEGFACEWIISHIDESKIEGAIFRDIDVYILDGSRNNLIDPIMTDCTEYIINIGNICDRRQLFKKRYEIIPCHVSAMEHNKKCIKFMNAAEAMKEDTSRVIGDCVNTEKIEKFISSFTRKEFGINSENTGKTDVRFLSAITCDGIKTQYDTVKNLCARIFVLDDKTGCVADPFIRQIKDAAVLCGYDVTLCIDPISGKKNEHIIIPELSVAVFTSNDIHKWTGECTKKISSARFTDREVIRSHRGRVRFNAEAVNDLLNQAAIHMDGVKNATDKIDRIYDEHLEKEKLELIVNEAKKNILSGVEL